MKPQILIVEDEAINIELLEEVLQLGNYNVCGVAASCEKTLECIEKDKPDLILMDVVIQGKKDGIDTTLEIQKNYDIPVIYMTGYSNEDIIERMKKTQPFGIFYKPINVRKLFTMVTNALV